MPLAFDLNYRKRIFIMNTQKVSFIICSNNELYCNECKLYINQLKLPDGFTMDIHVITNASSMTSGYNQGMKKSDAKYKVYLHQDVFILNKNFIVDTLSIFQDNPKIGMIGMVGTKKLPENGCMWTTPMRTGAIRVSLFTTKEDYFDIPIPSTRKFSPVQAIDGLLMMTQYDIPWREDLFTGWDFYDVSQSMEFLRQGYRIAVPYQQKAWVHHDNDFLNLSRYHHYRKIFLQEYFPEYLHEIEKCTNQPVPQKTSEITAIKEEILSLITAKEYAKAHEIEKENWNGIGYDDDFRILHALFQIYHLEQNAQIPHIFTSLDGHSSEWIFQHYQRIRFYLMRFENQVSNDALEEASKYFVENNVSEIALATIQQLICVNT